MTFVEAKTTYVELKPGEPGFFFVDGNCVVNRAAIKLSDNCPENIRSLLFTAISRGWVEPVAYVRGEEYCWDRLKQDRNGQ